MNTLILISSCSFPLSAVAGSILTGELPDRHCPGKIREIIFACEKNRYSEGRMCWIGTAPDGTRVAAFTARSGRGILVNLVNSFLEINNIDKNCCRIVEINPPAGLRLFLWRLALEIPLAGRTGKIMMEKYIEKIYPYLAASVKLDWDWQISHN